MIKRENEQVAIAQSNEVNNCGHETQYKNHNSQSKDDKILEEECTIAQ